MPIDPIDPPARGGTQDFFPPSFEAAPAGPSRRCRDPRGCCGSGGSGPGPPPHKNPKLVWERAKNRGAGGRVPGEEEEEEEEEEGRRAGRAGQHPPRAAAGAPQGSGDPRSPPCPRGHGHPGHGAVRRGRGHPPLHRRAQAVRHPGAHLCRRQRRSRRGAADGPAPARGAGAAPGPHQVHQDRAAVPLPRLQERESGVPSPEPPQSRGAPGSPAPLPRQECPSGLVDEETFTLIYSRFFPRGDASSYAHFLFDAFDADRNGALCFQVGIPGGTAVPAP
ncbi:uncharacterized protein LOC141731853 isoform X2 [Zonotrichia albicollis]|uniref:uncharacterized protein LOC141731853 isoform X2 n=1 Tax=Zonotrichia albicollis TaxID=44394 RepID=UPI003D811C0F